MVWVREAEKPIADAMLSGDVEKFVRLLEEYPDNLRTPDGECTWMNHAAWDGLIPFLSVAR